MLTQELDDAVKGGVLDKLAQCQAEGHIECHVEQYDLVRWKAQCFCKRCGSLYERPINSEEVVYNRDLERSGMDF